MSIGSRTENFGTTSVAQSGPNKPNWLSRKYRWYVPPPIRPEIRRTLLNQALRAYGPNCHWCGIETIEAPKSFNGKLEPHHRTLEHLRARSFGGHDTFANTRIACNQCNNRRSREQSFEIMIKRFHVVAPNKLFGCWIIGDEAV